MAGNVKRGFVAVILALFLFEFFELFQIVRSEISCPSYAEIPFCSCFVLDDQLHVQCSGNDLKTLQRSLTVLNGPVKSFSVYDLDSHVTVLPNGLTDNVTSPILQFSLSHSSLETLGDLSLVGVSKSLETLAIVSANLKFVPQNTLKTLKRLKAIDLEGNHIHELRPHSFNNVLLQKVNLKSNQLEIFSDEAFWGLEETLMEIDMSENKISVFPFVPLGNLRLLSQLNLAWNELSDLEVLELKPHLSNPTNPGIQHPAAEWPLLKQLNLNSNYLTTLRQAAFARMGNLRSLSMHLNNIQSVHEYAFQGLTFLQSIDISHNKIMELGPGTFRSTQQLITIDISNNHIHRIHEHLFNNLTELKEIFLNGNNLLRLSPGIFQGSKRVQLIYLQQNALQTLEAGILNTLRNLTEIRLSDNFLRVISQDLFLYNEELTSLALDGNFLTKIVPGTFHNCKSLRELRLQNNKITTILYGVLDVLPALEEVYLENNRLSLIQGLDTLRTLRHISLNRNSFERLSPETLPGTELSSLSLGHNQIKVIDDGAFSYQSSLNILFLGNNQLTRLGQSSLQGLPNLERLYLQRNNLSEIHHEAFSANLKAIQYIDLSFNYLENVSSTLFSQLHFLEELNLASNRIVAIENGSFTNLKNLRFLDLSSNKLSRIQYNLNFRFSGLQILKLCCNGLVELAHGGAQSIGLKELDLHDNMISAGNLRQLEMSRLEALQLSGNNLTELDRNTFNGFPALSFLSIDNCSLSSFPGDVFRGTPNLSVLRASDNILTYIPDNVFRTEVLSANGDSERMQPISLPLRELHLRHNRLMNFPYKLLSNASQLQVLSLSGNKINGLELSRIKLSRLKQFDMNDNKVSKISGTSLVKCFPILEVADFGENNISRLPDELFRNVSLTSVNFGGNAFTKIPPAFSASFMTLPYVLNMSGNPLFNFHTENHPSVNFSVMDLSLTDTNVSILTSDEFRSYPKLHRLVIKRNAIKIIPVAAFGSLVNLNLLDLSENDIDTLEYESFEGLSQLKSLNLSYNQIKTLGSFHPNLGGLQDLDLSFNQLSNLVPETLKHLNSLVSLRLRGNWITTLQGHLFDPLGRLSLLDLSHNFMETIQTSVLIQLETRISSLRLEENPWSCECESKEFWDWIFAHPKLFVSSVSGTGLSNFHCERPREHEGRLILEADLPSLCATPAILKLNIEVRTSSVVVSWDGGNNLRIEGYVVAYHAINHNGILKTRPLPPTSRFHLLSDLTPDTPYLVCVHALSTNHQSGNATLFNAPSPRSPALQLRDSPLSKCAQIRTLSEDGNDKVSILDRRLGVLVGAIVGFFVFIIFVTTLLTVKLRKRIIFRQQQNGKIDHRGAGILPETNNVGTLGGFHETHKNENHAYVPYGNGNGVTAHAHMSPDFQFYRHCSLATENGLHPSLTRTSELERL